MILDSNIWIAYLYVDDVLHKQAARLVEEMTERPLVIFEYSIMETVTVLAQRAGKETANRFLELIRDNRDIETLPSSPELLEAIVNCYKTHTQRNLSFADYALLHLSHTTPIVTFDTKLRNAIKRDKGKYYDGAR